MIFKVAEHRFRIVSNKNKALYHRMANYHPFEEPDDFAEPLLFEVHADSRVDLPLEQPDEVFEYEITNDKATLHIYREKFILSILNVHSGKTFSIDCPFGTERFQSAEPSMPIKRENSNPEGSFGDERWAVEKTTATIFYSNLTVQGIAPPQHIVDHLLIFAFSLAALPHSTLLIHASTIVNDSMAAMFLGESGTGKSTHSRMWLENIEGSLLLNDDAPALRVIEDKCIAYGTPWSGKTPCYLNKSYPLAACVRIRRAPFNRIHSQSILNAFGALLPSCLPTLQQTESTLDIVCATLSKVIELTPVYILDCLPDPAAAFTCSAKIL